MKNTADSGSFGSQKTMDGIYRNAQKLKKTALVRKPVPESPDEQIQGKYLGRGTRARLNTAANKMLYGGKASQ